MKTQLTTRYVLCVALLIAMLCGSLWAQTPGPSFLDDFSDGDAMDGSPVNWLPTWGVDATGYVLTLEGMKAGGGMATDLDGSYYFYRDVSITVQIKRTSDQTNGEWVSGLVVRWTEGATGGYSDGRRERPVAIGSRSDLPIGSGSATGIATSCVAQVSPSMSMSRS